MFGCPFSSQIQESFQYLKKSKLVQEKVINQWVISWVLGFGGHGQNLALHVEELMF
jgi:hypothetical protein